MTARGLPLLAGLLLLLAAPAVVAQAPPGRRRASPPQAARRATPATRTATGGLVVAPLQAIGKAAADRERMRDVNRFDPIFKKYTRRYFGIATDWRLFKAQGMAESNLDPNARSPVGARGIMQLMPSTYAAIATKDPEFRAIDDPEWNIAAGIAHNQYLWRLWDGDVRDEERWDFVFASYNAGRSTILRAQRAAAAKRLDHASWRSIERVAATVARWRHQETLGYVRKIRAYRAQMPAR
jgi:membrane-bound lytic murein transglycosylase F